MYSLEAGEVTTLYTITRRCFGMNATKWMMSAAAQDMPRMQPRPTLIFMAQCDPRPKIHIQIVGGGAS
jgi:hypothetical protein